MTALFNFDNTYAKDLPGFYASLSPEIPPAPELVLFNTDLAASLGLDAAQLDTPAGAALFSGQTVPDGAAPLAQVYAGHQFGGFSPQLGDGRAILLGELMDTDGQRHDLQLKGSGRTPFSRSGDGKAALGPVLREYIMGEAMYRLGIPTTRALAATTTGETVMRETPMQGAVLARIASSHLRVGTFQFFASRGMTQEIRQLADYAIARHDRDLTGAPDCYLTFLKRVLSRQANLIAAWMGVGFVHGVMNTDNMTISGETIDYGPCAFMEAYDPATVFSSIDAQGRYAYGNQPMIAKWNLARLAEALLPLLDDDQDKAVAVATEAIEAFDDEYTAAWNRVFCRKIGFETPSAAAVELVEALLKQMHASQTDFTNGFNGLTTALGTDADEGSLIDWAKQWRAALMQQDVSTAKAQNIMGDANPIYIPRNHLVEDALTSANDGDFAPLKDLLNVVKTPFTAQPGKEMYQAKAPSDFGSYVTYCGT